jgi:hypothetical protein
VELLLETRPRPTMLNRFYRNVHFAYMSGLVFGVVRDWLTMLKKLDSELGGMAPFSNFFKNFL